MEIMLSIPWLPSEKTHKRKWMADATKVIPLLPSEKTDKKEMDAGCNESQSFFASDASVTN